jgi:hypothetical protein
MILNFRFLAMIWSNESNPFGRVSQKRDPDPKGSESKNPQESFWRDPDHK